MEEANYPITIESESRLPQEEVLDSLSPIDKLILGFLEEKFERTQSKRTVTTYHEILTAFRLHLQQKGYDLLFDPEKGQDKDDVRIYLAIQARSFVAHSTHPGRTVSTNTRNLRLSALASFYEYAERNVKKLFANPVDLIKRSQSEPYNGATPLSREHVLVSLQSIDTQTVQGKRDYALLHLLFNTGQRVSAIQHLQWRNLRVARNGVITVQFEHLKGGKKLSLELDARVSTLLLDYLAGYYGKTLDIPDNAPVWVNLSIIENKRQKPGQALGYQAIRKICMKHLGESKVHTTRHTFASLMQEAGATTEELQEALLHSNIAVTQIYSRHLKRSKNTRSKDIADLLGL